MLQDLYHAVVLLLVLEGMVFAICPACVRRAAVLLREQTDTQLSGLGLVVLSVGLFLLYFSGGA